MEVLGWVVALIFAGLTFYFARRRPAGGGGEPSRAKASVGTGTPVGGKAPPSDNSGKADHSDTLREVGRYLDHAVVGPLEAALRTGDPRSGAEDAADALRDLVAYGASVPEAGSSRADVGAVASFSGGEPSVRGFVRMPSEEGKGAFAFFPDLHILSDIPNRPY